MADRAGATSRLIAAPILEPGGELYRYVGDEIVVTWRAGQGLGAAACVAFLFAIEGACRKFSRDYVASAVPLDRIAELPPGVVKESLGPVPLAGKSGEMEPFALERG